MKITKITLNNFRLYLGANSIVLNNSLKAPLSIISGLNGYGKTSFVDSIAWCLYGNLIVQVDDGYRKEIYHAGGYSKFLKSQMNRTALSRKEESKYSVEILFENVRLPGVESCQIVIKRIVDIISLKESLKIKIDGVKNQLTEEIGYEEFVNQYILPRELAKFFFFDSEKIVDLSDIEREDNKRSLFTAYSRVLGLNSYLELKGTLKSLINRLKKDNLNESSLTELSVLEVKQKSLKERRIGIKNALLDIDQKIEKIKKNQLIRKSELRKVGLSVEAEEVDDIHAQLAHIKNIKKEKRELLNSYLNYTPFLLGADLLRSASDMLAENSEELQGENKLRLTLGKELISEIDGYEFLKEKESLELKNRITEFFENMTKDQDGQNHFLSIENSTVKKINRLLTEITTSIGTNLTLTIEEIKESYRIERKLNSKLSLYDKYSKSDTAGEKVFSFKESQDILEKRLIDKGAKEQELFIIDRESTQVKNNINQILSNKKQKVANSNKIDLAERLCSEIDDYIRLLKEKRKSELEKTVLDTLNKLSHKKWITEVLVDFSENLLNIQLKGADGILIDKTRLSKGEQQMYASSILVSLIKQSSIEFPVIMDSPLQKLDRSHSKKFITGLYPLLGSQIILLPLLGKELLEDEYENIYRFISDTYLIENKSGSSKFHGLPKDKLFMNFRTLISNV